MEITAIIAFLIGNTFVTDCAQTQMQTQDGAKSGYARDSLIFAKSESSKTEVKVTFERKMYAAADCTGAEIYDSATPGAVEIGRKVQSFFQSNNGETEVEADWTFATNSQKELGAIGVNESSKTVRIARNSPGFTRNTMLNLIDFKASR